MSVSVAEHDSILVGVRSMTTEAALTITENGLSIKDAAAARKQNWNQNSALQAPQSIRIGWAYPNDVPEPIVLFIAADSEYRWQAFARFCKSDKGQEILRKTDRMFQSLPQDKRT
jgi:ABC-type Fe3+ transport system substrate-binding protein